MARIHKGGLSTNRGLCTSYDAFFLQTWFVKNKRRFVETIGGLSKMTSNISAKLARVMNTRRPRYSAVVSIELRYFLYNPWHFIQTSVDL